MGERSARRICILPDGRYYELSPTSDAYRTLTMPTMAGLKADGTPNVVTVPLVRCNPDGSLYVDGTDENTDPELYRFRREEDARAPRRQPLDVLTVVVGLAARVCPAQEINRPWVGSGDVHGHIILRFPDERPAPGWPRVR